MKEKLKEFTQLVKDNKKLAILSLVMLLTVIGGMAYAIFNYAFTGNQNTISVGPLSVTYLEGTNKMNITNALPISDEQGKESNSFDFVVKSNTSRNVNIVYTISLEKLSASSGYTSLNDSDIDIYLTSGNKVLKNVTKISELNNYELYRTTHVHNTTNREVQTKYSLRAWIDKDVDASNWKSTTKLEYKFRVNVNTLEVAPVTQTVTSGQSTNLNISNLGISANIPANSVSTSSVTLNAYPGGETFNISTEESTIPYEIKLTDAAGNDITSTSPISVQINIGTGLEVKSMMHGSTQMTKATSHAADTYEYDKTTGILTMYVTHFSEFKINVKKKEGPTPVSFSTDDWGTIVSAVQSGNTSVYNVGDTKEIDMGTYGTHTVRIANKSTPSECSGTNFSQTACGFVIEFADIITEYQMNDGTGMQTNSILQNKVDPLLMVTGAHVPAGGGSGDEPFGGDTPEGPEGPDPPQPSFGTNVGGWPATQMRTFVNNDIYNALPSELKNAIIDTKVVSGYGLSDSSNFTSTDKLYLLSTHEVWRDGTSSTVSSYDTAYNNTRQLDYYSNLNVTTNNYSGAIKKKNGSADWWWLRSATSYYDDGFFSVADYGDWSDDGANDTYGVSPAFRLG